MSSVAGRKRGRGNVSVIPSDARSDGSVTSQIEEIEEADETETSKPANGDEAQGELCIEPAPVFRPSIEEFSDPFAYIQSIQPIAEKYGMCVVIPPESWTPQCLENESFTQQVCLNLDSPNIFRVRKQHLHELLDGSALIDGAHYTYRSYESTAETHYNECMQQLFDGTVPDRSALLSAYWNVVSQHTESEVSVDTADDVTAALGSGFPRLKPCAVSLATTSPSSIPSDWNLHQLPKHSNSAVRHIVSAHVPGITAPRTQLGMLFSTRCWRVGECNLPSIDYLHFGCGKVWYSVPSKYAKQLDKVSKDFLAETGKLSKEQQYLNTSQMPPSELLRSRIPVFSVEQPPRSFVIAFAQAYTTSVSLGLVCSETLHIAPLDWLPYGLAFEEKSRLLGLPSSFCFARLLLTLLETDSCNVHVRRVACKVLQSELAIRPHMFNLGLRCASHLASLPPNTFSAGIDSAALEYDEKRTCCVCRGVCLFSAVVCECAHSRLACVRHEQAMCKCSRSKKYVLEWASTDELTAVVARLSDTVTDAPKSDEPLD